MNLKKATVAAGITENKQLLEQKAKSLPKRKIK